MSVIDQIKMIHRPKDESKKKVPDMPLLVALSDGTIYETNSVRGVVSSVVGMEYLDVEYPETEWHVRVETARRESVLAYVNGINSVVYDSRKGIIINNYAAQPDDPDYEDDDNVIDMPVRLFVDNDRLFILSFMKIGAIKVLERTNSYILRSHPKWEECKVQSCSSCLHKTEGKQGFICPVYSSIISDNDYGPSCCSFNVHTGEETTKSTVYIDLVREYDIDETISFWTKYYKTAG
jgi:hypothetical protein